MRWGDNVNCYGSPLAKLKPFDREVLRAVRNARGFYKVRGTPIRTLATVLIYRGRWALELYAGADQRVRAAIDMNIRRSLQRLAAMGYVERIGKAWRAVYQSRR
jgi:hypothetical protein